MSDIEENKCDVVEDGQDSKSKSTKEEKSSSTVNVNIQGNSGGGHKSSPKTVGSGLGFLTAKPVFGFICIYAVLGTGAWGYLLNRALKIPGLEDEVNDLRTQVNRLESLNKELKFQVDRLDDLNEDLKDSVDDLGDNIILLQDENDKLNATTLALREEVGELNDAVNTATIQNIYLNETVTNLATNITRLSETNQNLTNSLESVRTENSRLTTNIQNLTLENERLKNSVENLENEVSKFTIQVGNLQSLNDDLLTIVSFINETGNNVNKTLSQVTGEVAGLINENRRILIQTTENTYKQLTSNFECNFESRFKSSAFIQNKSAPIGPSQYPDVISWTYETYLSEVCGNLTDFEDFLATNGEIGYNDVPPPININSNQLIVGHDLYNTALLNYYFPDDGEQGLTLDDWTLANSSCENLPSNKRFTHTMVSPDNFRRLMTR